MGMCVHVLLYISVSMICFMFEYERCMIHIISKRRWRVRFYVLFTGECLNNCLVQQTIEIFLCLYKKKSGTFFFAF
jgi:hypothetical protein